MKTLLSLTVLVSLVFGQFSAPLASPFAQDVDATPTATQEITETPVAEPTASETLTAETTPTPAENETLTVEPTAAPTETPTPIAETATPVPTISTSTEIPASPVVVESPVLSLSTNPDFVTPGGKLVLSWKIEGLSSLEKDSLVLQITIPDGFTPQDRADGKFDETSRLLTISVNDLEGQVQLQTQETVNDAMFFAVLMRDAETLATTELSVPVQGQFTVNRSGGVIQALDGKVKVTFPDGALPEDAIVRAGSPAADALPEDYYSRHAFELKAFGKEQNTKIERFNRKLTIEVDYSDLELTKEQEGQLYLYWYNPETGDWHALESYPDPETKTLRALTDHFTVFDIGVNDWRATRLPTVDSFQVSKFTGAATYSLPIEVPPGPAGFQPNVTLSYNSQVVDQATAKAQSSWVGMGWSLDGGGSITMTGNNQYMLVVNGVSTPLTREVSGGEYRTVDENFWRIVHVDNETEDYWQVYDTQDNQYFFEKKASYRYYDSAAGSYQREPYTWYLSKVVNTFGQEMLYNYVIQTKNIDGMNTDTAAYLDSITYPNGRYRVKFVREARTDYTAAWDTDDAHHVYEKSRLQKILVQWDSDGDMVIDTTIRRYEFSYADREDADIIWPGVEYSAPYPPPLPEDPDPPSDDLTLTLRSVQEFVGAASTVSLPPTTFEYDNLHLTDAENGYGGKVRFVYDEEPWYNETASDAHTQGPDAVCEGGTGQFPWNARAGSEKVSCDVTSPEWLIVKKGAAVTSYYTDNPTITGKQLVRPGGVYHISFYASKDPSATFAVGLTYGSESTDMTKPTSNDATIFLPREAPTAKLLFKMTGDGKFHASTVSLLPSFYRVKQKIVSDGNGHEYEYDYTYTDPLVAGTNYEFRGHNIVTETAPNGQKTVTNFYQSEVLKGRPQYVAVKDANNKIIQKTLYTYSSEVLPENPWSDSYVHAWVHLDEQETQIYTMEEQTNYAATKSVYDYDEYGNTTKVEEFKWNGTGWGSAYRVANTEYYPRDTPNIHLTSLPARRTMEEANGTLLAETLYFYNGSNDYHDTPTANKLTKTRTLINAGQYAQVGYGYDGWGNQISVTTYTGYGTASTAPTTGSQTITTLYDSNYHTYPISVKNALLQETTFTYDYALGLPLTQTDPNDAVTQVIYDSFGRVKNLYLPNKDTAGLVNLSLTMTYTVNAAFPYFVTTVTQETGGADYTVTREYDGMGRQTKVTSGGSMVKTIYSSPKVTKQSMPYFAGDPVHYTITTIDPGARSVTVELPDETSASTVTNGLVNTVTDAKGNKTVTENDVWGRVYKVTPQDLNGNPIGPEVTYTYDKLNRMTKATRGGVNTILTYNYAGQKITMADPDMGYWTYAYDALGNLTNQIDARGKNICLYYDSLNRLAGKDYRNDGNCPTSPSYDVSYTYDTGANGIGRRTGMTSISNGQTVSSSWAYDARGRVLSETVNMGTAYTTSFTYNNANLPTSMTYPDGETVAYEYNERMLLNSLRDTNNTPGINDDTYYVSSTEYEDAAERLTARTLGNGLSQVYDYYAWNEKVSVDGVLIGQGGRLKNMTTGSLQDLSYVYDAAGNIRTITDSTTTPSEIQEYGYDALNRLTSWTLDGVTKGYIYNTGSGNLQNREGFVLSYGDTDHKHAATDSDNHTPSDPSDDSHYTYDANGNMVTRDINAGAMTGDYDLIYDAENRLVEVRKNNSVIASFVYDGDGRRVKATNNGQTLRFIGSHFEYNETTNEVTKYYFAGSSRIAMRKTIIPSSDTLTYLLGDHLGSTSLTTDASGNLLVETRYKPWGEVRYTTPSKTLPTRYTFTSQYSYMNDEATDLGSAGFDLMFYNARWYDPALGRFAQADSIIPGGVQGLDRYAYVNNSPLMFTDPSGHGVDCGIGTGCAKDYSGAQTLDDFSSMSWGARKNWLEDLIHESGSGEWLDDIKGAIDIISSDSDYKDMNGAVAYQNAAVLQSINDGWRIYNHRDPIGEGGSGFGDFFYNLRDTDLLQTDPNKFIAQRYEAEKIAISYAVSISESSVKASSAEFQFKFGLYQWGTDRYRDFGAFCRSSSCIMNGSYTDPRIAIQTPLFQFLGQTPNGITIFTYHVLLPALVVSLPPSTHLLTP